MLKNSLVCVVLAALMVSASASRSRMLIEGGKWMKGADGEDIYVNPPQEADKCTNIAPDQRFTCQQQKDFGACDADFMKEGNYCLYTCGRCPSESQEEQGEQQDSSDDQGDAGSSAGFNEPGNPAICDDIQPDQQYTCQQQRDFGKCREWYIVENHFCARTCGIAPCPPVANLPRRNGTSTSIRPRSTNATTTTTPDLEAVNVTVPAGTLVTTTAPLPVTTTPPIAASVTPDNATLVADNTTATLADDNVTLANVTEPLASPVLEETTVPTQTGLEAPVEAPVVPAPAVVPTGPVVTTTAPLASPVAAPEATVTEPAATVTPPEANVTAPDATVTAPEANVTAPEANVTAPDATVTAPEANVTAPDATVTPPAAAVTAPEANVTAPEATVTPPAAAVTAPEANVTAPALPVGNFTEVVETPVDATLVNATLVNATLVNATLASPAPEANTTA